MTKLTIANEGNDIYVNPALIRSLHTPQGGINTCVTFDREHRIIVTESIEDIQRAMYYDNLSYTHDNLL